MSIVEASERLHCGAVSPLELTERCLALIEALDPVLNSFITVTRESALREAREADREIRLGTWRGPLHGIPIALKDIIDVAGVRTTAGSALFQDRVPEVDAEVVRRLKAAGAVLLGKQNLHEFAYGGSSVVSFFGAVRNPWRPSCIAGGSSGGSAAAVAAGLCFGALGTDTGGSVREPAALCGIVGLKPTYGRVSACGVIPLSPSLDHVGPLAGSVADAAVMLQAIAGYDPHDPASADEPVGDYLAALAAGSASLRVGIPRSGFFAELDGEVEAGIDGAISVLREISCDVREVSLAVPADRTLLSAEAFAYHAEFLRQTPERYQPETLRRLRAGENVSAEERERLRREVRGARESVRAAFERVDLLVTPTVPVATPTIAELKESPETLRAREIALLRNTRPFNQWGLPAISVPCGFTLNGMPIGVQIAGPPWREDRVLALAHAYEQAAGWRKRPPAAELFP